MHPPEKEDRLFWKELSDFEEEKSWPGGKDVLDEPCPSENPGHPGSDR
jgi:hypothetical protein